MKAKLNVSTAILSIIVLAGGLMAANLQTALLVAIVHTAAMSVAGSVLAVGIYLWFGLTFLTRTWFNLDVVWASSLIIVGGIGAGTALAQIR